MHSKLRTLSRLHGAALEVDPRVKRLVPEEVEFLVFTLEGQAAMP